MKPDITAARRISRTLQAKYGLLTNEEKHEIVVRLECDGKTAITMGLRELWFDGEES